MYFVLDYLFILSIFSVDAFLFSRHIIVSPVNNDDLLVAFLVVKLLSLLIVLGRKMLNEDRSRRVYLLLSLQGMCPMGPRTCGSVVVLTQEFFITLMESPSPGV